MMMSDVSLSDVYLTQCRIQNLCKGSGVATGRRTRGGGSGEGLSPSPVEWDLGRSCAPPQKKKWNL